MIIYKQWIESFKELFSFNIPEIDILLTIYNTLGIFFLLFIALYNFNKRFKEKVNRQIYYWEDKLNERRGIISNREPDIKE